MYLISSRLELREVVSNATRRFSISLELTGWAVMGSTVAWKRLGVQTPEIAGKKALLFDLPPSGR
jgi:hypothetical protein